MLIEMQKIMLVAILAMLAIACSSSGSDSDLNDDDGSTDDNSNDVSESPTRAGDVLISELMADPSTLPDVLGEWIEVRNVSAKKFDLRDCVFSVANGNNFSVNVELEIDIGEHRTFAISAAPGFLPDFNYNGSGLTLNNLGDTVTLTCNGVTIDARSYTGSDNGRSSALSNNGNAKWCTDLVNNYNGDTGSPGATNIVCP